MKRDNKKFAFGDNWLDFYKKINSKKIKIAKKDIRDFIGINIKKSPKIKILSVAPMFANVIKNVACNESISKNFIN